MTPKAASGRLWPGKGHKRMSKLSSLQLVFEQRRVRILMGGDELWFVAVDTIRPALSAEPGGARIASLEAARTSSQRRA
jgi:hypothetical protein